MRDPDADRAQQWLDEWADLSARPAPPMGVRRSGLLVVVPTLVAVIAALCVVAVTILAIPPALGPVAATGVPSPVRTPVETVDSATPSELAAPGVTPPAATETPDATTVPPPGPTPTAFLQPRRTPTPAAPLPSGTGPAIEPEIGWVRVLPLADGVEGGLRQVLGDYLIRLSLGEESFDVHAMDWQLGWIGTHGTVFDSIAGTHEITASVHRVNPPALDIGPGVSSCVRPVVVEAGQIHEVRVTARADVATAEIVCDIGPVGIQVGPAPQYDLLDSWDTGRCSPFVDPSLFDTGHLFGNPDAPVESDSTASGVHVVSASYIESPFEVFWPEGYVARFWPRLEVLAPDGEVIARGGRPMYREIPGHTICRDGLARRLRVLLDQSP